MPFSLSEAGALGGDLHAELGLAKVGRKNDIHNYKKKKVEAGEKRGGDRPFFKYSIE